MANTRQKKQPIHERESVRRALMRLPVDGPARSNYAQSLGIKGNTLTDLLNRVDGLHLSSTDAQQIAVDRIHGNGNPMIRRRRRS